MHSIDSVGLERNKGTSFVEAQKRGKGKKMRPRSEGLGKGYWKPEGALRMGVESLNSANLGFWRSRGVVCYGVAKAGESWMAMGMGVRESGYEREQGL